MLLEHAPERRTAQLRAEAKATAIAMGKPSLIDRLIRTFKPSSAPDMKRKWW